MEEGRALILRVECLGMVLNLIQLYVYWMGIKVDLSQTTT
jgi:hypothetical protein